MIGYLTNDTPPIGAKLSLGFQQFLTMFPATVIVAALTKFDVGMTLLASGLGTNVACWSPSVRSRCTTVHHSHNLLPGGIPAIVGILTNLIFVIFEPKGEETGSGFNFQGLGELLLVHFHA